LSAQRLFNFSRFVTHRPSPKVEGESAPDVQSSHRSLESIIDDLKSTLNFLLGIRAQERPQHFRKFKDLCDELEKGAGPFPPEVAIKIDSLLWFCERMCRPDFVPSDGHSFFLAWPHTLLDSIKERLQR
jgi:hypothetical protein